MYREFAFNRNRNEPFGDIHTVSNIFGKESGEQQTTLNMEDDGLCKKYDKEFLHNQLKPLILMLRVLASFPLEMSKSG
jgi:hypothetical protein